MNTNLENDGLDQGLLLPDGCSGGFGRDEFETDLVARPELADAGQIRGNDVRDFRIAAGGLLLDEEDDRFAARRDLDRAERDSFGGHLAAMWSVERGTFEPQAHAVRFLRHYVGRAEECPD